MENPRTHLSHSLTLDNLAPSPALARRLSPALAFRYHALPVAEDRGRITVAMADPDDAMARAAVAAALGTRLYVVQSDPEAIDELLAEIWPQETRHPLQLLVYRQSGPVADEVQAYARYLSNLLDSQLTCFPTATGTDVTFDDWAEAGRGHDLVILGEPDPSLLGRMLPGAADRRPAARAPASVLIARRPRWPLRRMLLVIRDQSTDDVSVDWIVRLAQPSGATVRVLALVPPVPAMGDQAVCTPHGLAESLAADTTLGRQIRRIARRLVSWESEGILRFRQGPAESQLQREVAEGDYDLIVIAADPPGQWLRQLLGELASPLLNWTDRPVLIANMGQSIRC